ncbi:sugar ABC transporter substrate-binding protein [Virgibacillus sp. C22-A2]|uniref:Sugar ABC transporter substrate-binding protein n=1 Tax=Virgibacillus tibetensis TaxID=3042313 RepID=A0ABU6KF07_9BACI|nr:sugar ABC transporter substrate-binding protein [Virgibacillus sp. C22-A2]
MKKYLLFISLIVMVMLAACSSDEEGASGDEETTIKYAYWDKNQEDMLKDLVEEFNKDNPTIEITLELTPYDQYFTKLDAAASGGGLPDVFWMNGPNFVKYASNDMLESIDESISEDDLDTSPYPDGLLGLYQYEDKTYALPKDYDTIGLWYNKELFDEAGLDYPDESWDWEDLVSAAESLTNPEDETYGIAAFIQDSQATYFNTILAADGYIISKDKTQSGFDDPNTIEGIQKYHDLIHKHEVSPTHVQMETTNATSMFESGKVAMMFQASYMIPQFKANEYTNENVDVAVLPTIKKRSNVIHGLGNVIASNSENKDGAWEFVKFLSSEKAATIQAEAGIIPAYEGTQQSWVEATPNFNLQAFLDMAEVSEPYPVSKDTSKWATIIQDNLAKAWAGQLTVEEASEIINKEMEEILASE